MASLWDDPDIWGDKSKGKKTALGQLADSVTSTLANIGEGALRGLPDALSFGHDFLQDASAIVNPSVPNELVIPGTSPTARKIQKSFDEAEDKYTKGNTPRPKNKVEQYAHDISEGVSGGLLGGGPEAAIPAVLSGVAGAGTGRAVYDLTGNDTLSTLAGLAAGIAVPGAHAYLSNPARAITKGASHPDFGNLVRMVEDREGGGTFANPKVNPKSGAMGPMQVTPETARDPGYGIRPWNGKDQSDLARVGRQKLAALMGKYDGDVEKAFAAYNWGEGHVDAALKKYGDNWLDHAPKETQNYVEGVGGSTGGPVKPMNPEDIASAMGDTQAEDLQNLASVAQDNVVPFDEDYARAVRGGRVMSPEDEARLQDMIENPDNYPQQRWVPGEGLKDQLTPAEAQDMDASVPDYGIPPEAVDARTVGQGADYPEQIAANDASYTDQGKRGFEAFSTTANARLISNYVKGGGDLPPERWDQLHQTLADAKDALKFNRSDRQLTPAEQESMKDVISLLEDAASHDPRISQHEDVGGAEPPNEPPSGGGEDGDGEGPGGPMRPTRDDEELTDKLANTVKNAKPLRKQQDSIYHEVRSKRMKTAKDVSKMNSGESGFFAEKAALAGDLPKVDFEGIRGEFNQDEINRLHDIITEHPRLGYWDKIKARDALQKILGDDRANDPTGAGGGKVPTPGEIRLLSEAFGDNFGKELTKKLPLGDRVKNVLLNALNLPRALRASFDLSAPLRQGINLIYRKEWWKAFATMFRVVGSEKAFKSLQDEIVSRDTYPLMQRAGLALTYTDRYAPLTSREEQFMSQWAENIPGVKASERAYVGFLNKLRADTFDTIVKQSYAAGIDFRENPKALRDIGKFVNNATGRGDLPGAIKAWQPTLNATLFSPRLMASRVRMLTQVLRPETYLNMNPVVRKEYFKSMFATGAIISTIVGLAKLNGAEVETDPASSDFLKIKIGDLRKDLWGGYQQYVKLAYSLASGRIKSVTTGKESSYNDPKYGQSTRKDALIQFISNKENPVAATVDDLLTWPKEKFGEKITPQRELKNLFLPMVLDDLQSAYQDSGEKGVALTADSIFGVGNQVIRPKASKETGVKDPFNDPALWGDSPGEKVKDPFSDPKIWGPAG